MCARACSTAVRGTAEQFLERARLCLLQLFMNKGQLAQMVRVAERVTDSLKVAITGPAVVHGSCLGSAGQLQSVDGAVFQMTNSPRPANWLSARTIHRSLASSERRAPNMQPRTGDSMGIMVKTRSCSGSDCSSPQGERPNVPKASTRRCSMDSIRETHLRPPLLPTPVALLSIGVPRPLDSWWW
jgi:hypothetical protein